jgi:YtkA-like
MKKRILNQQTAIVCAIVAIALVAAACGLGGGVSSSKEIKSIPAGNSLTVTLSSKDGALHHSNDEVLVSFKDSGGNPVDVGAVALNFHMPTMGTMPAMHHTAALMTTSTPGVYRGKLQLESGGEWQCEVAYDGPKGSGKVSMPVMAQ